MRPKNHYKEISLNYKIWLSSKAGEGIMGDGKWLLLKTIDNLGSLSAAADKLNISYRKAWGDLKKIEEFIKIPIIEKHRGGKDGGNTVLTIEGKKLVKAFDNMHEEINKNMEVSFSKFLKNLAEKN